MAITKRSDKGSALTYTEMDDNFDAIAPRTSATGAIQIPAGTTGERDVSPQNGYLRYNTSTGAFEGYQQGAWAGIGGGTGGAGIQGVQGITGAGAQGIQGTKGATGAPGVPGTDGADGIQGVQGPLGFQGTRGITGDQGTPGTDGAQGTTGIQGSLGFQGTQGTSGANGTNGAQGIQGLKGADSTAQGFQGLQGITGDTGDFGPQGTQGITGSGAQGSQGIQGSVGFDGQPGQPGSQGIQGVQGDVGIQGNTGPAGFGAQGIQGTQGLIGPGGTGPQGIQGITGSGIQGPIGPDGGDGPQGTQGFQGPAGSVQGIQGITGVGDTGPQGIQGTSIQGITGSIGAQGIQGSTGIQGVQGAGVQGFDGSPGIQGFTGFQGATGPTGLATQGTQGVQGVSVQGFTGTGIQGVQGFTGQGVQGITGIQGVTLQGLQGPFGPTGTQGIQGISGGGGTMSNLIDDTTPQLGGDLDANNQDILMSAVSVLRMANLSELRVRTSTGADVGNDKFKINYLGDVTTSTLDLGYINHITTGRTDGSLTIRDSSNVPFFTANTTAFGAHGLSYPTADGTNGQVLKTDGAGNLAFTSDISVNSVSSSTLTASSKIDVGSTWNGESQIKTIDFTVDGQNAVLIGSNTDLSATGTGYTLQVKAQENNDGMLIHGDDGVKISIAASQSWVSAPTVGGTFMYFDRDAYQLSVNGGIITELSTNGGSADRTTWQNNIGSGWVNNIIRLKNSNMGIGTDPLDDKLTVAGTVAISEVLKLGTWGAAPPSPIVGTIAVADRINWDPAAKGAGNAYPVFYDGTTWVAMA